MIKKSMMPIITPMNKEQQVPETSTPTSSVLRKVGIAKVTRSSSLVTQSVTSPTATPSSASSARPVLGEIQRQASDFKLESGPCHVAIPEELAVPWPSFVGLEIESDIGSCVYSKQTLLALRLRKHNVPDVHWLQQPDLETSSPKYFPVPWSSKPLSMLSNHYFNSDDHLRPTLGVSREQLKGKGHSKGKGFSKDHLVQTKHYFDQDLENEDHKTQNCDLTTKSRNHNSFIALYHTLTDCNNNDHIMNNMERANLGLAVPLYVGLNLQCHQDLFQKIAVEFAIQLAAEFHIDLHIPFPPPLPSSIENSSPEELICEKAVVQNWFTAPFPKFRWPNTLHMTSFYCGSGHQASPSIDLLRALELEGTEWLVQPTHLVYAENALLVATLDIISEGLPRENSCIPHVTLLTCQPFTPGHAHCALEYAFTAGLLASPCVEGTHQQGVRVLPQVQLDFATVDLYVQCLTSPKKTTTDAISDDHTNTASLHARLENFWSH